MGVPVTITGGGVTVTVFTLEDSVMTLTTGVGVTVETGVIVTVTGMVEVSVTVIVESEWVVITLEDPLAETVLVTGHVVTVVRVISVTVDPSGAGELDSGLTLVGTVTLGAEVGPGTTAVLVVDRDCSRWCRLYSSCACAKWSISSLFFSLFFSGSFDQCPCQLSWSCSLGNISSHWICVIFSSRW